MEEEDSSLESVEEIQPSESDAQKSEQQQPSSSSSSSQWCTDAEIRFFKKILSHKPAGVSKHFHMMCLVDYMNNVYEDEDTDFDDVLSDEDLHELNTKKNTTGRPRVFKPKYKLRPSPQMIWDKLEELYDMKRINENECLPEGFLEESEFNLPEEEFGDLLRRKAELNRRHFVAPQTSSVVRTAVARRKRRDSGETQSSRSSTPASRDLRKA